MVSGREGSPSPMGEGKAERHRQKSPSNYHMVQREELLGWNENIPVNLPNALNAKVPSSPLMSPKKIHEVAEPPPAAKQSKQRLRSPGNQSLVSATQDVLRISSRRSPRKEAEGLILLEDLPLVPAKRSSSRSKDKSPHNSRRFKAEMVSIDEEQLDLALRQKPKGYDHPELQEKSPCHVEKQSSRSGRTTRRSRVELHEIAEVSDNVVAEPVGKATRRGQGRTHTRHHKRKAPDPALPAVPEDKSSAQCAELPRSSCQPRKSRKVPEATTVQERTNWIQYMADLVMWKDTSKSALVFGFGSFCVLSSFFTQDLPFSFVTIASYLTLFYLAAVFFYKSFIRREAFESDLSSTNNELSEADALRIVKVILPPVNALFAKSRELFSGDPSTTLKLASVLWLLAECGHMMTIWTLIRLAYFIIFIIPKLYSCYSDQVHQYGEYLLFHCWEIWNACSHKKAVLAGAAALAWNLSSITSRVLGAFILVVALRLYQQSFSSELGTQNEIPPQTDGRGISGLELTPTTRTGN